jgi:DNA-binding transcriptional ArsR family regulator
MGSLFPLRGSVSADEDREPRLVDLDEDTADEVFDALSSRTTRTIFLELHDQPQAASDLAELTDTSVQNAQYHLEKLTEAELIEVVDTWYSERGSEMKVYAPVDESLVLYAGRDKESSLRTILRRFVGAVGTLVPTSVGVGWLAGRNDRETPSGFESSPADETTGADQSDDQATTETEEGESSGADGGDADATGADGGDAEADADTSAEDDPGGMEIQSDQLESATADGDTTDLSEISDFGSLSETAEGGIDISGNDLLIETGNQSVNATARLQTSANETTLTIDPADLTALTTQSSGADPVVAGLSFFFGGLFIVTVAVVWSVWR